MGSWKNWQTELAENYWLLVTELNILFGVRMGCLECDTEICFETNWLRKSDFVKDPLNSEFGVWASRVWGRMTALFSFYY